MPPGLRFYRSPFCTPPEKETCADHLQTDLYSLSAWSGDWQLKFNASKCSSLHFGHGNVPHQYFVSGQPITSNNCERDLGVLISNNLKPSSHIAQIVKCAEMCLAVLRRTIVSRDRAIFLKLYKQLVRPHLEYAVSVWNPHLKRDIERIEKVQRRATKCINGMQSKSYQDRLHILGIDSLQKRRCVFDLVELFKIIHNLSPLNFDDFFSFAEHNSTRGHQYKLAKKYSHLDCRKYFFVNRVVNVWNALPDEIVSSDSLYSFKRKVSSYVSRHDITYFSRHDIS